MGRCICANWMERKESWILGDQCGTQLFSCIFNLKARVKISMVRNLDFEEGSVLFNRNVP